MDEEVKTWVESVKGRFDDLDKRIAVTDKRFDDVKYFAGGVSILLSILAVIAGFNFSNERAWLRESVKDIREEVTKLEVPAEIELLGPNRQPLAGQEIVAQVLREEKGEHRLRIDFISRNVGKGTTGPVWFKVYASDPLRFGNASSDETAFKYEAVVEPKDLSTPELPGKISTQTWLALGLEGAAMPAPGKYPVMLRSYYGKGKVASANFIVVLLKK